MVLFLLNSIFLALGTLSTLFFQIIFNVTAYMLVLVIQSFKVPGEAAKGVLEQVADVIKLCVEYLVGFTWEVISSLVSALFDIVKEGIFGSVVAAGSAIGGLLEHARNSVDGFLKELIPEVLEGFSEMISTIVTDIWNNYKEAVGYVTENA